MLAYRDNAGKLGSRQSGLDKLSDPMDDVIAGVAVILAGWTLLTRATSWWRRNNTVGQGFQPTWHRLETTARAALDQWRTFPQGQATST